MWRLLEGEYNGFMNMALDEVLMSSAKQSPIIRFYDWGPPCVSLGYFQSYGDVNSFLCAKKGVDIVRRITGGRAIYHNSDEITYSVIAPEEMFGKLRESYSTICSWIMSALESFGMECRIDKANDIVVGGRKISGNAQVRIDGILLQHGTIIVKSDVETMMSLLSKGEPDVAAAREAMTSVHDECGASKSDVYGKLVESFSRGKEIQKSLPTQEEMRMATQLVATKYSTDKWNKEMMGNSRGICYIK